MFSLHFPVVSVGSANTSNHSNYIINKPLLSSCSFPKNSNHSLSRLRLETTQKWGVNVSRKEKNEIELGSAGLDAERMPKHVAVIMDGNRRWAIERGFPPQHGYVVGAEAMKEFTKNCLKYGVNVVTLFAISTENFVRRPKVETEALMKLMPEYFSSKNVDKLLKNDVRLSFIGNRRGIPENVQKVMSDAEERTKEKKRMHVLFTMNYGGRYDIVEASKKIADKVKTGVLQVEDIDDAVFEQHLVTNVVDKFPNPDLVIRTSGELRISNSMLWQLTYTEMFFTNKCFPEFDEIDFVEAIEAFQQRKRRFGGYAYHIERVKATH